MSEHILIGISLILALGVGGAWLCTLLKFPPIVFYLLIGFIVGPITRAIDVDAVLGEMLMPLASILVALILFEGGLTLKVKELQKVGSTIFQLNSIGVLINWGILVLACDEVLKLPLNTSMLLASVLIVTGPTAVKPLLRHMRLKGNVGSVVKWEGIVIEPIGAMLAIVLLQTLFFSEIPNELLTSKILSLGLKTVVIGLSIGTASASFLVYALKNNWIHDSLKNAVTLMLVVCAFTTADVLQESAGFLSATIIGIILTNQKFTPIKRIISFKHDLSVLIIPGLFIVLASRLTFSDLTYFNIRTLSFLLVLFFVSRPLSVLISTIGTSLSLGEKIFLSFFAPRGILAAAVVSLFSLQLIESGYTGTNYLVSITFIVIIATVTVYSAIAKPLANFLKISDTDPQGVLFVGAHKWSRDIAKLLQEEGLKVLLVDTDRNKVSEARLEKLPVHYGNILSEDITDEVDLNGIGNLFSLTKNFEVNSLSAIHFAEYFGTNNVYQLLCKSNSKDLKEGISKDLQGEILFSEEINYESLDKKINEGNIIKKIKLTEEYTYEEFKLNYGEEVIPLCVVTESKKLLVFSESNKPTPKPDQTLICLTGKINQQVRKNLEKSFKKTEAHKKSEPGN